MANPFGQIGRAPAWSLVAGELWERGLSVGLGSSVHGHRWRVSGWGGSTTGSAHHAAGGVVEPNGLSPEAASRVTSGVAVGHRASESSCVGRGCWVGGIGIGPS